MRAAVTQADRSSRRGSAYRARYPACRRCNWTAADTGWSYRRSPAAGRKPVPPDCGLDARPSRRCCSPGPARNQVDRRVEKYGPIAIPGGDYQSSVFSASKSRTQFGGAQRRDTLLEGQVGNLLVAWQANERILRDLEAQQCAGRAGQHLAQHRETGLFASAIQPVIWRHSSGLLSRCRIVIAIGRPAADATRRSIANSSSGSSKSLITCSHPASIPCNPRAIVASRLLQPAGSGSLAGLGLVVDGARCRETQRASLDPFHRESAISTASASVAGSRSAPRRPMTNTRTAACGTWVATSRSYRRASSASR